MSVGAALRNLGRFLDECEREETVSSVALAECSDSGGGGPVTAEITVAVAPQCAADQPGAVALSEATIDDDGRLQFTFESVNPVGPMTDYDIEVHSADATVKDDGTIELTLAVSVPTDDGGREESAAVDTLAETAVTEETTDIQDRTNTRDTTDTRRERDVPPFRDPELLAEVYESCDTFAEMTDELGMDVTPETVRRYMVDYDIHQPNSYDTGDDDADDDADLPNDAASQVVIADGMGLPDDVTVDNLIETVKRSNTIYEIKQDIGIEREDALEMLRELNLLDLVVGRLATEAKRDISRAEVVDRLREASTTE